MDTNYHFTGDPDSVTDRFREALSNIGFTLSSPPRTSPITGERKFSMKHFAATVNCPVTVHSNGVVSIDLQTDKPRRVGAELTQAFAKVGLRTMTKNQKAEAADHDGVYDADPHGLANALAASGFTASTRPLEMLALDEHLAPGEKVELLVKCRVDDKTGIIVLTDSRVLVIEAGLIRQDVVAYPLSAISALSTGQKFSGETITFHASGRNVKAERIDNGRSKPFREKFYALTASTGAPVESAPDAMDQLRKLGELHQAGVLTDDEFAAKKADLLGRM